MESAFLKLVSRSRALQIPLATIIYAACAAILGAGMSPGVLLALWAFRRFLMAVFIAGAGLPVGSVLLFSTFLGGAVFAFFFFSLLIMGLVVRLLSLGVRPGRHALATWPVLIWTTLNTVHTMAVRIVLPVVPAGYFTTMYFRLAGCRLGRNVWLIASTILDPYLISIGDDTVVGGDAVISAHMFMNGGLYLAPISIGKGCQIGAHALISAGATLGDGAVIGMRTYIRRGRKVPAGANIAALGGLALRAALDMERESDQTVSGGSFSHTGQRPAREPGGLSPRGVSRQGRSSG
ncbi:MAG: DapH/DapD/GlmU-related protein [Spirochaetia bacterium]|jgi:acetyltransferase-like isoleucine patch superfamily enzyme